MLKTLFAAMCIACLFFVPGCSDGSPAVVVDDAAEMEQFNTPADYDPSSEESSSNPTP